jgi:tungstate transport system substrate-binding protein
MKSGIITVIASLSIVFLLGGLSFGQDKVITMSTTTSTEASGLLDHLLPEFKKDTGITVRVMSKGTGAALRDGMDGNADVVFVHDVAREKKFVEEGYGTKRYYVMYNDFIIVGPKEDPAGIKGAQSAAEALMRIAKAKKAFCLPRGRQRDPRQGETVVGVHRPAPDRGQGAQRRSGLVFSIGQGMGEALLFAEEKNGYVLADRGTYLQYKYGRSAPFDLEIVYEGGDMLQNPYGVIPINPEKHPHVKYDLAKELAEWLVSKRGQEVIGSYKLLGHPLFFPDAK